MVHLPGYTENGKFRKSDYLYSSMSESKCEVEGVWVLIKTWAECVKFFSPGCVSLGLLFSRRGEKFNGALLVKLELVK